VSEQSDRLGVVFVYEEHIKLAITPIGPMMRAGTIGVRDPGNLQVKSDHGSQSKIVQLPGDPGYGFVA